MRILGIRFKNLNSLFGEWEIDFTHPAFVERGIFVITGRTGAGKSTILDALCLALYGMTPRLDKVTKNANEAMSRHTGECLAEVTFETPAGRFRAVWSQRRAKKSPAGELQPPRHEVACADTGRILGTGLKETGALIEKLTGMDFRRFTRSMLLAQGGFAAFLKAGPDERALLLEQLTGTECYSAISRRVFACWRSEGKRLDELRRNAALMEPLDEEARVALEGEAREAAAEERRLAGALAAASQAAEWLKNLGALREEERSLEQEWAEFQTQASRLVPERERLELARRAAVLEKEYAGLGAVRKQLAQSRDALNRANRRRMDCRALLERAEASFKETEEAAAAGQARLEKLETLWQTVRRMDERLNEAGTALMEEEKRYQKEAAAEEAARTALTDLARKMENARARLAAARRYLEEHARDEGLVGELAGIEEAGADVFLREQERAGFEKRRKACQERLEKAGEALEGVLKAREEQEERCQELCGQLGKIQEALKHLLGDRLPREFRAELEGLLREQTLHARIATLETLRAGLEDGDPCPLCGAKSHPYVADGTPAADDVELKISRVKARLAQIEAAEEARDSLEKMLAEARGEALRLESREEVARKGLEGGEAALAEAISGLEARDAALRWRLQKLEERLLSLGACEATGENLPNLLERLRKRREKWLEEERKREESEAVVISAERSFAAHEAAARERRGQLEKQAARLAEMRLVFEMAREERAVLFGERQPGVEEKRERELFGKALEAEKEARMRRTQLAVQAQEVEERIGSLNAELIQIEKELHGAEERFSGALAESGFLGEEAFLAALMEEEEKKAVETRLQAWGERRTILETRRLDTLRKREAEENRKITDKSPEVVEYERALCEAALAEQRKRLWELQSVLKKDEEARRRLREAGAEIQAQEERCATFSALSSLIGSADGKKFRAFVQGLTFGTVVRHANLQLREMTDRYLLSVDPARPLELDVIDSYQAGETRSTKNLSGGEMFLVSLALALGLSQMASDRVRVDSLFLDEGFGTLDEETLETVLETLAALRRTGKVIGVISHIPALRERLDTRIEVYTAGGGRSRISGPGCRGSFS